MEDKNIEVAENLEMAKSYKFNAAITPCISKYIYTTVHRVLSMANVEVTIGVIIT